MDAQMEKDYIKGGAFLIENRNAGEIFTPEDLSEEQRMIGDAVVCPEQRAAMSGENLRRGQSKPSAHCGACGLCWKGDAPIVFVKH